MAAPTVFRRIEGKLALVSVFRHFCGLGWEFDKLARSAFEARPILLHLTRSQTFLPRFHTVRVAFHAEDADAKRHPECTLLHQ